MSLFPFPFAFFLFLSLNPHIFSSTASTISEDVEITYGSVVKLMHEKTKFRLHSHDLPYGSGSGQQSVTGFPSGYDANSYWVVKPELGASAKQGDPIVSSTIIRLQHSATRKWLHSHSFESPLSGNQEVSCYGSEKNSDTGDDWRLVVEGTEKTWKKDQRVRLQHVDTGVYLQSHKKKYSMGQQEVCGVRDKNSDNIWIAAEGVYFPVKKSNDSA
ncbi:stromal cell-derived factor 2-like protein [Amaranthus tricolor]|uniref:stromal cell-derived factor 2-like protein n=1 Tax=Amaranthus tricolor TaxID=29722 RepID=UPI00258E5E79|nr:stromal cell-derived factor 2-like protein [Amaranthus tricolor]